MLSLLVGVVLAAPVPNGEAALARLAREDQADRRFTGAPTAREVARMERGDRLRQARAREILRRARSLTAQGFSDAALLFQHGASPADYELAHFLAIAACAKGKLESMPALSEDRFLGSIGRTQRFGAQFTGFGDAMRLDPVDEKRPTAVTDTIRLAYLLPPIAMARKLGLKANQVAMPRIFETIEKRRNPNKPLVGDEAVAMELASLSPSSEARRRVLELYDADRLVTADDFLAAARILASSADAKVVLLAHELATLAFSEGRRAAGPLVRRTWSRFNAAVSRTPKPLDCPALVTVFAGT